MADLFRKNGIILCAQGIFSFHGVLLKMEKLLPVLVSKACTHLALVVDLPLIISGNHEIGGS